jgi:hypothetical protein
VVAVVKATVAVLQKQRLKSTAENMEAAAAAVAAAKKMMRMTLIHFSLARRLPRRRRPHRRCRHLLRPCRLLEKRRSSNKLKSRF